jgi:hypothetical protein
MKQLLNHSFVIIQQVIEEENQDFPIKERKKLKRIKIKRKIDLLLLSTKGFQFVNYYILSISELRFNANLGSSSVRGVRIYGPGPDGLWIQVCRNVERGE